MVYLVKYTTTITLSPFDNNLILSGLAFHVYRSIYFFSPFFIFRNSILLVSSAAATKLLSNKHSSSINSASLSYISFFTSPIPISYTLTKLVYFSYTTNILLCKKVIKIWNRNLLRICLLLYFYTLYSLTI